MKVIAALGAFLAVAAGTLGLRALDLKGSDTLRSVTTDILNHCPGAAGALVYKGGGSGAGEGALVLGTQTIAPMSRFLAGSPGAGVCSSGPARRAEGVEFAGDDIGLWFDASHQLACDSGSVSDLCVGYSDGGISFNKPLACGVTLTNWKDVARLIYFGLRPSDFPLPSSPADPNGEVSPAAVGRRDCRDACRDELRNNFALIFQNACNSDTGGCTKLQHAFRRDEDSGTTDFFRESLGVEGGTNNTNKGFPFCNEYIPRVTQNVASVAVAATGTGGTCTVGTSTGCPATGIGIAYVCQAGGTTCKRPNNGCAVTTSATDCPAGSKCDGGQLLCAKTCTADGDCTTLGSGARCDTAAGMCIKAVDGCSADADCASGFKCDMNANGGTCSPPCTPGASQCTAGTCTFNSDCGTSGGSCVNGSCRAGSCTAAANCGTEGDGTCSNADALCSMYLPGATCNTTLNACTRTYGSICPAPGLVTGNSTTSPASFGGTVAGAPGVARTAGSGSALGVGFENQQDNDLLRWAAVGTFSFNLSGAADTNPAEQVASMCGDLGLVLPISEPPADASLPQDPSVFPTTLCGRNRVNLAPAIRLQGGLSPRYLLCPNGDMPYKGTWDAATGTAQLGTGNCFYPQQPAPSTDFRCLNGSNNRPGSRFSPPPINLPSIPDGRAYNLHLFGASSSHATQPYLYNAGAQPPGPLPGESETQITQVVTSAFYRIHSTRTLLPGPNAVCTGKGGVPDVCCVESADTQQIGCLVQGSPCSMGFAGLAAGTVSMATGAAPGIQQANFAAGLNTNNAGLMVSPNGPNGCIPNGPPPVIAYPVARNLFVNTISGFETLPPGDPQLTLVQCFTGAQALSGTETVKQVISRNGFVNLGAYPCCKDFDEAASCSTPTCTAGACTANTDCGTSGTCSNVGATCSVSSDCGKSGVCAAGVCTTGTCTDGTCTSNSQCGTSAGTCGNHASCADNGSVSLPTTVCSF